MSIKNGIVEFLFLSTPIGLLERKHVLKHEETNKNYIPRRV